MSLLTSSDFIPLLDEANSDWIELRQYAMQYMLNNKVQVEDTVPQTIDYPSNVRQANY